MEAFDSNDGFAAALKSAFEFGINSRESKPAELIGKYVCERDSYAAFFREKCPIQYFTLLSYYISLSCNAREAVTRFIPCSRNLRDSCCVMRANTPYSLTLLQFVFLPRFLMNLYNTRVAW